MARGIQNAVLRGTVTLLSCALAACGGGGGGGGSAPTTVSSTPPTPPSVTPAALFTTTSGTLLTNSGTQEYPLYGVAFPTPGTTAYGDIAAGRRVNADGSISLTFQTNVAHRSVHFTNGDISSRNLEGITARKNDVGYFEFAAADEPLNGGSLAYARAGAITFDDASLNRVIAAPFYFGWQTPVGTAPTSGIASYRGGTLGYDLTTFTPTLISGDVHIELNFANNKAIGHISDLQEISSGGTSSPYGNRFIFSNVNLSRNSQDVTFSGDLKAVDKTTGVITNGTNDSAGRPGVQGRVFGPNGEELAGLWQYNNGGARLAWGSFATRTESASHPSGAFSSLLTVAGSVSQSFALQTGNTFSASIGAGGQANSISAMSGATGSLTPAANGSISLAFTHTGNSGTVTYSVGDLMLLSAASSLGEIVSGQVGNAVLTLGDRGALSYARFGYWMDRTAAAAPVFSTFHVGRDALPSQLPTSGTATYVGTGVGLVKHDVGLYQIHGDTRFQADFSANTISGSFTVRGGSTLPGGIATTSQAFTSLRFDSVGVTGAAFNSGPAVALDGSTSRGTGTYGGRFYGPTGEEIAGHWNLSGTSSFGHAFQTWGAFGASR